MRAKLNTIIKLFLLLCANVAIVANASNSAAHLSMVSNTDSQTVFVEFNLDRDQISNLDRNNEIMLPGQELLGKKNLIINLPDDLDIRDRSTIELAYGKANFNAKIRLSGKLIKFEKYKINYSSSKTVALNLIEIENLINGTTSNLPDIEKWNHMNSERNGLGSLIILVPNFCTDDQITKLFKKYQAARSSEKYVILDTNKIPTFSVKRAPIDGENQKKINEISSKMRKINHESNEGTTIELFNSCGLSSLSENLRSAYAATINGEMDCEDDMEMECEDDDGRSNEKRSLEPDTEKTISLLDLI